MPHRDVLICADYVSGGKALQYGYPWLVPGAIVRLCQLVNPRTRVLEWGAGGSTVFFAGRCASVTSYETHQAYLDKVAEKLESQGLDATLRICEPDKQIETAAAITEEYDAVLVDSHPPKNRGWILEQMWRLIPVGGFLIVDNYRGSGVNHARTPPGWALECYDDAHWLGWGTAIIRRML